MFGRRKHPPKGREPEGGDSYQRLRAMALDAAAHGVPSPPAEHGNEPKLDGWRALVTLALGEVQVTTRTGRDVSASLPELGGVAGALADRQATLDRELVVGSGASWDFYRLGPRMALGPPGAACADLGLEGAVAKRMDSPYRPGVRSPDWVKLKTVEWRAVHAERRHARR